MTIEVVQLELSRIRPSPLNASRSSEADHELAELAESIRIQGLIQPITVRPIGEDLDYEIVAGERRWRASQLAGLESIAAIVRDLTDEQALELILVENLQRRGLTPLAEADGYRQLLQLPGHDAASIAAKIGRSVKYVYDRIKLLALTPASQDLVREGAITAGHAILLARLSPTEQSRAVDEGVFTVEELLWRPGDEEKEELLGSAGVDGFGRARKAVSVRELEGWIDNHIRFDAQAVDPMLFPQTAETLEQAAKVVQITHENVVDEYVRKDGEGRIYGPRSWKSVGDEPCDHQVTGVIVSGPGRGEAFPVCTSKKTCKVHWAKEQKEAVAAAKHRAQLAGGGDRADRVDDYRARQEREDAERKRWQKAAAAILEAIAAKVKRASTSTSGELAKLILRAVTPYGGVGVAGKLIPLGKSAEDLVRHASFILLARECAGWQIAETLPKAAKLFGVDAKKMLAELAPAEGLQTSAEPKKPAGAKKPAKAKKSRKAA